MGRGGRCGERRDRTAADGAGDRSGKCEDPTVLDAGEVCEGVTVVCDCAIGTRLGRGHNTYSHCFHRFAHPSDQFRGEPFDHTARPVGQIGGHITRTAAKWRGLGRAAPSAIRRGGPHLCLVGERGSVAAVHSVGESEGKVA